MGLTTMQMVQGKANNGVGPIPTQTFYAANIAGTTVPKVGSAQAAGSSSNYGYAGNVQPVQIAMIAVVIIGLGYLLHHLYFEESVKVA